MAVQLRKHQLIAVDKLDNGKILWGGVGSGKSITAVAYYMKKEAPKDVYVITTAKKRDSLDWESEFSKFGVGKTRDGTVAGVLNVDSWNNIGRYQHIDDAFFIFDEQRLVGSGDWTAKFLAIAKRNRWILLSATPGDNWLDYIPVFLANGYYRNRTEFKHQHVVYNTYTKFPKVDRYIGVGKLVRMRNELLVEMPYRSHTTPHPKEVLVGFDQKLFDKVWKERWNPYENRPIRDVSEMFHVARKVVNSDPSRLAGIRALMAMHSRLIIFYNFDYELEILRTLSTDERTESVTISESSLPNTSESESSKFLTPVLVDSTRNDGVISSKLSDSGIGLLKNPTITNPTLESSLRESSRAARTAANLGSRSISNRIDPLAEALATPATTDNLTIAEWNGHKHQQVPTTERWVYLVQYAAGGEGWNCITTNAMAFWSMPYSYKQWRQAHGRIDRLNTPFVDLYYYTLMSLSLMDLVISQSLSKKRSFNEAAYVKGK